MRNRTRPGGAFLVSSPKPGGLPSGKLGTFVSNTNAPQQVDYRLAAGFALVIASAVTPQGDTNASEYQFGTHAQAIHSAEALKSKVWGPAAAPVVVQTGLGTFVQQSEQFYADIASRWVKAPTVGVTPQPIPLVQGAPQLADLTIQAIFQKPLVGPQGPTVRQFTAGPLQVDLTQQAQFSKPPAQRHGPVPPVTQGAPQVIDLTLQGRIYSPIPATQGPVSPLTIGAPQTDTTQIAAWVQKAQPAPTTVPNPAATFFSVPPQTEERPTRQVFPSQVAGQTPPVISRIWAAPQQVDLTQQGSVTSPAITPPVVSFAVPQIYAAPQPVDLTQQGWILGTAPGRQGPVPPMTLSPEQANPANYVVQATITESSVTPPLVPNLHKLYYDVSSGRLFIRVSKTSNPIEILPL